MPLSDISVGKASGELTIGEVVEALGGDYPDLTVSSLRFLEREGLLTPERSAGGQRRYSQADVRRVRFIKEMQRRFFPLNVIRDLLKEQCNEKGELVFFRPAHYDPKFVPLAGAELAQAAGLSTAEVAEMIEAGLLAPSAEGKHDEDDLETAKTLKQMMRFGLEPRDLAFHVPLMKAMAEEEIRLMVTKVIAKVSLDDVDSVALQIEELGDRLRHVLHAKVLRRAARGLADQVNRLGDRSKT